MIDMSLRDDAGKLFDHYENFLGEVETSFEGKDKTKIPFIVLAYSGRANGARNCLITCGLSAHQLAVPGGSRSARTELAIFSNSAANKEMLNAVLTVVGLHLLETHESPGVYGILPGSGPVLAGGNPLFESFYLSPPVGLPREFSICSLGASEIEILQLVPITAAEEHMIKCGGWAAFEEAVSTQGIDLLGFDEREEVLL
ncbi:suppressor of fused domain protein [Massilia horti]|uniref:Suppressor of fused-like domain-containing protein n=1 Tax=Massilia horti TaxID=2562153 RepID=A0A4Y9SRU1_9BURK|nr:suppressor of fused domain protein [Massilia horti]TFW29168.1 hypothetical protein E4O92_19445 [Massilia horti]